MIRCFFGNPGCGKTTHAVKMAYMRRKKYKHLHLNFPNTVPGCTTCDLNGLGTWTFPEDSYVVIDESGIEFNNRAYQSLTKPAISWFKKHRHYKVDCDYLSQSWEDTDITLRRLTVELWYLKRVGWWTLGRRVYKRITVDKQTEQIIDGYHMASPLWLLVFPLQWSALPLIGGIIAPKWTLTFRPRYYRYFDSWEREELEVRQFPIKRQQKNYFVATMVWLSRLFHRSAK